jgi:hypothetical protein
MPQLQVIVPSLLPQPFILQAYFRAESVVYARLNHQCLDGFGPLGSQGEYCTHETLALRSRLVYIVFGSNPLYSQHSARYLELSTTLYDTKRRPDMDPVNVTWFYYPVRNENYYYNSDNKWHVCESGDIVDAE